MNIIMYLFITVFIIIYSVRIYIAVKEKSIFYVAIYSSALTFQVTLLIIAILLFNDLVSLNF